MIPSGADEERLIAPRVHRLSSKFGLGVCIREQLSRVNRALEEDGCPDRDRPE